MRRYIKKHLPSMFQRRLTLLLIWSAVVIAVLALQMTRLTVLQGAQMRSQVEESLVQVQTIPTVRGRILDRFGRVLALDRPSYDLCVDYSVLTGDWAYRQARRQAWLDHRSQWGELSEYERDQLAIALLPGYEKQIQTLWNLLAQVGNISRSEVEQRKATIIRRVQRMAGDHWMRRYRQRQAEVDEPVSFSEVMQPIREQTMAHALLFDVRDPGLTALRQFIVQAQSDPNMAIWQHVTIESARSRAYPFETVQVVLDRSAMPGPLRRDKPIDVTVEGVSMHLVGMLRPVWKEDLERPLPDNVDPYIEGDFLGNWGIERSHEWLLRGQRGEVSHNLETRQQTRREPVSGRDVVLTVDQQLQARVQAIMDPAFGLMKVQDWHGAAPPSNPLSPQLGDPLNGAAVVLDIATSQVLAAVSMPELSLSELERSPETIWSDHINEPYVNRVVSRTYQPGSTVKPLVLTAAVTDGRLGLHESVFCQGHLLPESPGKYRCWIYKGYGSQHGSLAGDEAIARSCNIFFYTLGRRLGARRLASWYDRFNFGRTLGTGLAEEWPGELPDWKQPESNSAGLTVADGIFLGIGQGPIRCTPLQMAAAYATLARGGRFLPPAFTIDPDRPVTAVDLGLNRASIDLALDGLDDAVNQSYGTGHHLSRLDREPIFNFPGARVRGKSGTAQAVPHRIDSDNDGRITSKDTIVREGDHAWFVGMVTPPGKSTPAFVVVVVVEFGGSGGNVAGPVANQILYALRAEGYL